MDDIERDEFGPNIWLVDEMYRRYEENPSDVSRPWREFFEDYRPTKSPSPAPQGPPAPQVSGAPEARVSPGPPTDPGQGAMHLVPPSSSPERVSAAPPASEYGPDQELSPLSGVAARLAKNMQASLGVPTATSVRDIPAKLLEENRRTINRYLATKHGGRVSFTHLIGWAVLKGLEAHPQMKSAYAEIDGKPHTVRNKHVNFGIAVDVQRADGSRALYVPTIHGADDLDFAGYWSAYEEAVRKVRSGQATAEDFAATTVTLTNPGTIGTRLSVPRLMPAQGLIVGTGAIQYPSSYEGSDPRALARLGVSKTVTITSTYDHRVIQGAESGEFLAYVHDMLIGGHRFYDEIFASLRVPYEPVRWSGDQATVADETASLEKQARVQKLVNMYRVRGHLLADLNPIGWEILSHRELDLSYNGLTVWDLDREFVTDTISGPRMQSLRSIIDNLRDAYCSTMGVEYMHISEPDQKRWIRERVESPHRDLDPQDKRHILDRLIAAEAFERFLHTKYTGHKRFSLEGAESLIPMLDVLFEAAVDEGMVEVVMGMAHRGRLNVLANIVGKPLREIFKEFEGDIDPDSVQGSGDVKYHLGMTGKFKARSGEALAVVLASNPSHLEAVDPVVEGMARAKQDLLGEHSTGRILPVLLHGDAAFAGQGVVAETLNLSGLQGYRTGGTVHIVVNNQLGFTTAPESGRSSVYATDVAKMVQAPILHVNSDDPEACVRAARIAFDFRREFAKDVVIDLVCYRRHGHNEGDEPAFTQPLMYARIQERRSVRKIYTEQLLNKGELTVEEAERSLEQFQGAMQAAFEETKEAAPPPGIRAAPPPVPAGVLPPVETGVERARLEDIHRIATSIPPGFNPHPKLKKQLEQRAGMLERDEIDWASAETLAFGSLLLEGFTVRLSGQDSRRGTFSQRHSAIIDHLTGEEYVPLKELDESQAPFRAFDSLLSEFAALGFEYGYAVANGDALVCWEAQFGDFGNGAQVIVDEFIVAGEEKWDQSSGLVVLLPHGYEGQGPDHSSARLERWLTLAAEDSIQVVQPTTAAQYFHVLRRQMHRSVRKPLIVLTPKSLLRAKVSASKTQELVQGRFFETLDDPFSGAPEDVRCLMLSSGKIAYALMAERDKLGAPVAVARLEQLYPFPHAQVLRLLELYSSATEMRWVQEEPENMGAWTFVNARLSSTARDRSIFLSHASRPESASPATGVQRIHEQEHEELLKLAFEGLG